MVLKTWTREKGGREGRREGRRGKTEIGREGDGEGGM